VATITVKRYKALSMWYLQQCETRPSDQRSHTATKRAG